jgi:hypothetical protein
MTALLHVTQNTLQKGLISCLCMDGGAGSDSPFSPNVLYYPQSIPVGVFTRRFPLGGRFPQNQAWRGVRGGSKLGSAMDSSCFHAGVHQAGWALGSARV